VKAIVLAAGYATRLRPLTDSVPKMLLPLAGRPMLDYVVDRIDAVEDVDEIHVVTNDRFAQDLEAWAADQSGTRPVAVWNDGTTSNDDRLGAIGDMRFVVEQAGLHGEDVLVVAGDNLFEFDLSEFVAFWRSKGDGSAICVHDVGDLELAKQYALVELNDDDLVTYLEEKPAKPASTLAAIAIYLYRAEDFGRVEEYLGEGNSPDQPGRFVVWLYPRIPVYGYRFPGSWLDIGDREQLLEADNRMRRRSGLEPRPEYSLEP
jgi:glucose-1-phosphate thymidylyltransferase